MKKIKDIIEKKYKELERLHEEKQDLFIYIYLIGIAFLIVGGVIYLFIYESSSFEDIYFLNGIIDDLKKTPILDLVIKDDYLYLEGYERHIFAKYNGTNIGCKCEDEITKGDCSEEQKRLNCDFFRINKDDFDKYRNKYFFVKRENFFDFHKHLIVPKNKKCPKGKKQCGILDSLGNILCLNETEACPLNDILIDNKESKDGYKSEKLNEGKFIHFINESTTKHLISDFSVFYQDKPCFYSQDIFWETFMPLEIEKGSPGCKKSKGKTDERFKLLNKYNLSLFYYENYIYSYSNLEIMIPEKKKYFIILQ